MNENNILFVLIIALMIPNFLSMKHGGDPDGGRFLQRTHAPHHDPYKSLSYEPPIEPSMLHRGCGCSSDYAPVCGTDGRTHFNYCSMLCTHAELAHHGTCDGPQPLGMQALRTGCKCRDTSFPVCGAQDGKTYGNLCKFRCYGVIEDQMAHYGACKSHVDKQDRCRRECERDTTKDFICGDDGTTYRNKCEWYCMGVLWAHYYKCEEDRDHLEYLRCRHCQKEGDAPVCGKDEHTYRNMCSLKCRNIELDHMGECTDAKPPADECRCNQDYEPVCGVDGVTYQNMCQLQCEKVDLASVGPCEPEPTTTRKPTKPTKRRSTKPTTRRSTKPTTRRRTKSTTRRQTTEMRTTSDAEDFRCDNCDDQKTEPVCAMDNVTYRNKCMLECRLQFLKHDGACETDEKTTRVPDATTGPDCTGVCSTEFNPVCGVDGKTYGNMCKLTCSAEVPLAYEGPCRTPIIHFSCFIKCAGIYDPVCGVDGRDYGNRCLLDCAKVKLAYPGPCNRGRQMLGGPQSRYQKECSGLCHTIYDPVCGLDGRTYGNMCKLNCVGKTKLASYGKCKRRPESVRYNCDKPCKRSVPRPERTAVCGVDGNTYLTMCSLTCEGKVKMAHRGSCNKEAECNVRCRLISSPVCGVDGKTYGNPCELECYGVEQAYGGECKKEPNDDVIPGPAKCRMCVGKYYPVCSTSNDTFGNMCLLRCAGAKFYYLGPCKYIPLKAAMKLKG